MAIRTDFAPGEVLAAGDLNDTFGAKLNLAGGKILQVVRATDTTSRSTTSTSFVDVTGMSVTITPQKSTSAILLMASFFINPGSGSTNENLGYVQIVDSSNNPISGAQETGFGTLNSTRSSGTLEFAAGGLLVGYSTPATTSAVTYKLRFRSRLSTTTTFMLNADSTGQLYAIEVSA